MFLYACSNNLKVFLKNLEYMMAEYIDIIENDLLEDVLDDDLEVVDFIDLGIPRRYNASELDFFKRFRLTKETVISLLEMDEGELEYPDDRNNSLSPLNQLLLTLRYFASSGYLITVADFMNVHVSTASRVVARVSDKIASLRPHKIKMPEPDELVIGQQKFHALASFSKVQALIDCTHIKIQSTGGEHAEVYRNRKTFFSINVQCLVDADLKFVDVVARWPGSVHDSTIFANSVIRARFEQGHFTGSVILGDSGYPLKNYLLTLLANPINRAEHLYNESLIRTRNAIERTFGIWKRRFPVMAYGLRLKMNTTLTVILATAVLHNITREMNEPEPPLPEDINEQELNYLIETQQIDMDLQENGDVPVNAVQAEVIRYFSDL